MTDRFRRLRVCPIAFPPASAGFISAARRRPRVDREERHGLRHRLHFDAAFRARVRACRLLAPTCAGLSSRAAAVAVTMRPPLRQRRRLRPRQRPWHHPRHRPRHRPRPHLHRRPRLRPNRLPHRRRSPTPACTEPAPGPAPEPAPGPAPEPAPEHVPAPAPDPPRSLRRLPRPRPAPARRRACARQRRRPRPPCHRRPSGPDHRRGHTTRRTGLGPRPPRSTDGHGCRRSRRLAQPRAPEHFSERHAVLGSAVDRDDADVHDGLHTHGDGAALYPIEPARQACYDARTFSGIRGEPLSRTNVGGITGSRSRCT